MQCVCRVSVEYMYSTAQKQANHRTRFKSRANAFAFGTKRVCVCVGIQTQTQQNAFVKLISRSHFKIILHNRRLNKADFFVGRSLLLFYASVLYSPSELGNKRFRRISFLQRCQKKINKTSNYNPSEFIFLDLVFTCHMSPEIRLVNSACRRFGDDLACDMSIEVHGLQQL